MNSAAIWRNVPPSSYYQVGMVSHRLTFEPSQRSFPASHSGVSRGNMRPLPPPGAPIFAAAWLLPGEEQIKAYWAAPSTHRRGGSAVRVFERIPLRIALVDRDAVTCTSRPGRPTGAAHGGDEAGISRTRRKEYFRIAVTACRSLDTLDSAAIVLISRPPVHQRHFVRATTRRPTQ
jgi:hypothetical protein